MFHCVHLILQDHQKHQKEHDKLNELIDQATLEYVDNEFVKEKPSNDDHSIFFDFVASVNDEHILVDNLTTNEHHALDNNFESSNEHDLGRNINNDDAHTLKGIDIENDPGTNLTKIASELDDEKMFNNENGACDKHTLDFDIDFAHDLNFEILDGFTMIFFMRTLMKDLT